MAVPQATLRQTREQDLLRATRALFDERGMQDAPIEEIARSVGIARGLVYRQFSSKEELFVLTVTTYLAELAEELTAAVGSESAPVAQIEACTRAYAGYCQRFPAFLDCSLSLMRRPARELYETVSESVWLRLGQGMARCISVLADVIRDGAAQGVFEVEDPDYMANALWTQGLGIMHLGRIKVGVRQLAPGVPGMFSVAPEQVVETCVASALGVLQPRAGTQPSG
jgi:AcrR family transcriptional regulator